MALSLVSSSEESRNLLKVRSKPSITSEGSTEGFLYVKHFKAIYLCKCLSMSKRPIEEDGEKQIILI